jgi:tRNA nucleotidyltransferase (CCA-adding enzyme)
MSQASILFLFAIRFCYHNDMRLTPFLELAKVFQTHGFRLWLIGGSTRDYLLNRPVIDFDLTTDALPTQMQTFLPNANFRFAHYGTVQMKQDQYSIDITTLRQESLYQDKRHPQSITFVKEPKLDYLRRDLTINALYMDANSSILDFAHGQDDLNQKILRMIGNPYLRMQEDPLRILRVIRFQHALGFSLEPTLAKALQQSLPLLDYLNPQKVTQELNKMLVHQPYEAKLLLASYGIQTD